MIILLLLFFFFFGSFFTEHVMAYSLIMDLLLLVNFCIKPCVCFVVVVTGVWCSSLDAQRTCGSEKKASLPDHPTP